jgi:TIR domain
VLGGVFISYRREDSGGFAGRIYDRLTRSLGSGNVFFDVDSIAPGVDFVDTLNERLGRCDALVAVIGRSWLSTADANNHRRLDDPSDYVRLEIEAALQRSIRVIPVLVDSAILPKSSDLPESLAKLTRRQAIEISLTRFDSDVERLIEALSALEDELRHDGAPTPDKAQGANAVPSRALGAASVQPLLGLDSASGGGSRNLVIPIAVATAAAMVVVAAGLLYFVFGRHGGPHPWKPSFDCRLASGKSELMICDNEQLSELDNELSVIYYTIRKSTSGDDLRQLDSAESVWVVERNTCGANLDCVKKEYDGRIEELKTKLSAKP